MPLRRDNPVSYFSAGMVGGDGVNLELIRSLIFVPGNRANMLERAKNFPVDIIMVDLEDSVPPEEKVNARHMAIEWVPKLRALGHRVMVRVNSLDTGLTKDELIAVVSPDLAGISLGKVESSRDVRDVDRMLLSLERAAGLEPGQVKIIPWIENARAMVDAYQVATASPRIVGVAFGAEDYTDDMSIERTDTGEEICSVMGHQARFSMQGMNPPDLPSHGKTDRLVTQAAPQDRHLAALASDKIYRDTSRLWMPGPRRNDDSRRGQLSDLLH